MAFMRTLAQAVGWCYLLASLGGMLGAWDFHVCLKAPEGACSKTTQETRTTRAASLADGGFPHTTLDRK